MEEQKKITEMGWDHAVRRLFIKKARWHLKYMSDTHKHEDIVTVMNLIMIILTSFTGDDTSGLNLKRD